MGHIRIEIDINSGPTTVKTGFTEAAVEVSITNSHPIHPVKIDDLRLMFSKNYGAPVLPNAPQNRDHQVLPAEIAPQSTQTWYFHAEKLSSLLENLYRPPKLIRRREVQLYIQCILGTKRVLRGPWFMFTTDQNSHFPAPKKLHIISNIERLLRAFQERWKYVVLVSGVVVVVWRILTVSGII